MQDKFSSLDGTYTNGKVWKKHSKFQIFWFIFELICDPLRAICITQTLILHFIILIVSMLTLTAVLWPQKWYANETGPLLMLVNFWRTLKSQKKSPLNPLLAGFWNSPGTLPSHWQAFVLCSWSLEMFLQVLCKLWDSNSKFWRQKCQSQFLKVQIKVMAWPLTIWDTNYFQEYITIW